MPTGPGQYFSAAPNTPSRPKTATLGLPDLTIELTTDRAVFSPDRIDTGTKYLLLAAPMPDPASSDVLDLGAGYGPIAIALAHRLPNTTIWASEVNERAANLCVENARRADVADRVRVQRVDESDVSLAGIPPEIQFDAIYSNPPIRIGKQKLHALLLGALGRLRPDGHALLVVQKHLGSDSLHRWLNEQGWPTERLSSKAGYRILDVHRPS